MTRLLEEADTGETRLGLLEFAVQLQVDWSHNSEIYRKLSHTDRNLLFDSRHLLAHKLGLQSSQAPRATDKWK